MGKEQSEIYASLRLEGIRNKDYEFKKKQVKAAYDLIQAFKENCGQINDEIREKTQLYFHASYGINYYEKINTALVSDEKVLNNVNEVIQNSGETLVKYYLSFKRKNSDERIKNAWEDLIFAYKTYCLSNDISINENITEDEIEVLVKNIQASMDKEKNDEQLK